MHPLDLLRLVNLYTSRNWFFRIKFLDNKNHIHISADPPLTEKELLGLLDGKIPSLYGYEQLAIMINDEPFVVCPQEETRKNQRATSFHFSKDTFQVIDGQLKIVGFPPIPTLQKLPCLTEWVHVNTWYGSAKYENKKHTFSVLNLANSMEVSIKEPALAIEPFFKKTLLIDVNGETCGNLIFISSPNIKKSIVRHSRFGEINIISILSEFWKVLRFDKQSGIVLEIDTEHPEWFTALGPIDITHLKAVLSGIREHVLNIYDSPGFKLYQEKVENYRKVMAAQDLQIRQKRYEDANKIIIDNEIFMKEPTCENEVVALYMKLEAAKKFPFDVCKVLEYTSKKGIDALGDFRIRNTETIRKTTPIEFEYMLDNFWDHGHPIEQTTLIICWNKTDEYDAERCYGGVDLVLHEENNWLYYLQSVDRNIPVVFLSQIPAIKG